MALDDPEAALLPGSPDEAGVAEAGGVGRVEVPRGPGLGRGLLRWWRSRLFADRSAPGGRSGWGRDLDRIGCGETTRGPTSRLWCDGIIRSYSAIIGFRPQHPEGRPLELTADEVRHIARLARVALSDDEVERFRAELSSILQHCQALSSIDTADVPPTAQSFNLVNVERADEPGPSEPTEHVLANAPRREAGYFRVRAVLD